MISLRRHYLLRAYLIDQMSALQISLVRSLFIVGQTANKRIRGVPYKGTIEIVVSRVHENESFTRTERTLHRIFRCLDIYLAEDLCLFVKGIDLLFHKLGLNSDDFLETLGLAQFVHECKIGSNILCRVAQEYSI